MSQSEPLVPAVPAVWPQMGNRFTRWIGRTGLRFMGWRCTGYLPDYAQLVVVGGPHTSNWDFVVAMFSILALGIKVSWLGKHSIFRWPVAGLWYKLGGIPVQRSAAAGLVEQMVDSFKLNAKQVVVLAPEGTRAKVAEWKTGFLRIARGAHVPIMVVGMDFPSKTVHFGTAFFPGDDVQADLERVKSFVRRFRGKRPEFQ